MIADVYTYVRARMSALGFTEWEGFVFENIPNTRQDKAFHLELGEAHDSGNNQDCQSIEAPFTVRLFVSNGRNAKARIALGIAAADRVISDLVKATNRLTQTTGLKNVRFVSMGIAPLADSNDNGVIVKIAFTALVLFGTR